MRLESDAFDYLLVIGHYMTVYAGGYFDQALVTKLLPLMKGIMINYNLIIVLSKEKNAKDNI